MGDNDDDARQLATTKKQDDRNEQLWRIFAHSVSFCSVRVLHHICGSFCAFPFRVFFSELRRSSPFVSRAFGVGCPTGRSKDGRLLGEKNMAKKGRAARILNTLHKVNGTKQSEALKRRERKRPSKEFGNFAGETNTTLTDEWKTVRVEEKKSKNREI